MIFLSVLKDENGSWYIAKILTTTINVTGNASGITYGNIATLDLATRLVEGFWTQNDVYLNNGEFMQYKEKIVTFDEVNGVVTNTYVYERMDLDVIKYELKTRVDIKRDDLYYGSFDFDGNTFFSGINNRSNIQLMMLSALIDETNFPTDLVWDTVDGVSIPMDLATFKLFVKALADFTRSLFITARTIKANIDAETVYEDIRAAGNWNGELL